MPFTMKRPPPRKAARLDELAALVRMELSPEDKDEDTRDCFVQYTPPKRYFSSSTGNSSHHSPSSSNASTSNGYTNGFHHHVPPTLNGNGNHSHDSIYDYSSDDDVKLQTIKQQISKLNGKLKVNGKINGKIHVKKEMLEKVEITVKREPPDTYEVDVNDASGYGRLCEEPSTSKFLQPFSIKTRKRKSEAQVYTCAVQAALKCTQSDTDESRFTALNRDEHFCKVCQFELCMGSSEADFISWKEEFSFHSKKNPSVKAYVQDRLLPFWLRCKTCHKFREVPTRGLERNPLHPEDIEKFTCGSLTNKNICEEDVDSKVSSAWQMSWMQQSNSPPLLINSPACPFIDRWNYYYDMVGMSPAQSKFQSDQDLDHLREWARPFHIPHSDPVALTFRAGEMEYDEKEKFPAFIKEPFYYVAVRNLIVSLWTLNPFKYLTFAECEKHLICHGLSRIWYSRLLRMVYDFLNIHGAINTGVLPIPRAPETKLNRKLSVIVVGAGLSGLTAARQLRSFGVNVTVLDAKNRIGGRMNDAYDLGSTVGKGAQIVTGVVNSPIILICMQKGFRHRALKDECPTIDSTSGKHIDVKTDELASVMYNAAYDGVCQWRNLKKKDHSLLGLMEEQREYLNNGSLISMSPLEKRIFYWHIANSEYACGAPLEKVSASYWDQNESIGQFDGRHSLLVDGAQKVVEAIAEDTNILMDKKVSKIKLVSRGVVVQLADGSELEADKVLVTVPLAVLKKGKIQFEPPLPKRKADAIQRLGAGRIEKIAVSFPRCFWKDMNQKNPPVDYFAHVGPVEQRGLFHTIYDFTNRENGTPKSYVLMSYVCGKSVELFDKKTDDQVIKMFIDTLKKLFPGKNIPKPVGYMVSRWGKDEEIGMSYSYMAVGAKPEDYDSMAAPVSERIYFAGEATHRFFPQTMHGSYLSGLRATTWMLDDYLVDQSKAFVDL